MKAKRTIQKLMQTCVCFVLFIILRLLIVRLLIVLPAFSMAAEQTELNLKQILLMPGELTQSHAKFEPQCNQCHLSIARLQTSSPVC
jgi:hypothetical protein